MTATDQRTKCPACGAFQSVMEAKFCADQPAGRKSGQLACITPAEAAWYGEEEASRAHLHVTCERCGFEWREPVRDPEALQAAW